MSVTQEQLKKYLENLEDWRSIDLDSEAITIYSDKLCRRTKRGQVVVALRHGKAMIKKLLAYTEPAESEILNEIYHALIGIPEVPPDDMQNPRKWPHLVSKIRALQGKFNHIQQALITATGKWIAEKQCTSSNKEAIKEAVFAMAFFLKVLRHDLAKEKDKPLTKAKFTLLSVAQRRENLASIDRLLELLESKSLQPLIVEDDNKKLKIMATRSHKVSGEESTRIHVLTKQIDELLTDIQQKKQTILKSKKSFDMDNLQLLMWINELKQCVNAGGMESFWGNINTHYKLELFLQTFVDVELWDNWRLNYQVAVNSDIGDTEETISYLDYINQSLNFCWNWTVDRYQSTKLYVLQLLYFTEVTETSVHHVLEAKLDDLFSSHTKLAPGEIIPEDKVTYLQGYHDKRLDELRLIESKAENLKLNLDSKKLSVYLRDFIANTSWWVWLFSSEYRHLCNTIISILDIGGCNPKQQELKLVFRLLERAQKSTSIWWFAKLRLDRLMQSSIEHIGPMSMLKLIEPKLAYNKKALFFPFLKPGLEEDSSVVLIEDEVNSFSI